MNTALPAIPAKRYFTIGEVAQLCGVKPHVLRYWEQEFTQLRPMKRRGNRRYYQRHEVLMIRRIRELLYDQGFTINGARNQLQDQALLLEEAMQAPESAIGAEGEYPADAIAAAGPALQIAETEQMIPQPAPIAVLQDWALVRKELEEIRQLLILR